MWDEIEEKRAGKPYLWVVFLLLLLLLSSIFFLRPSVGSIPTGNMPGTRTTPVVTNAGTIPSTGRPLYMGEGATGVWGVYQDAGRAHVSFFNSLGDEQWAESIAIENALVASKGNYLAITSIGSSQFALYHGRQQMVHLTTVPDEIVSLSVNDMGEVLVCTVPPPGEDLVLRTQVILYSGSGQQQWQKIINNFQPLLCQQSADGSKNMVLGFNLSTKLETKLIAFGRQAELLFSADVDGQPLALSVRDDGQSIAVASSSQIETFNSAGQTSFKYDTGGEILNLSYAGRGNALIFLVSRKSMLNFRQQSVIGSLSESGKLAWQYRSNEQVIHLGTARLTTNIIIGTDKRTYLYGADGQARWSLDHAWGTDYHMATNDGRHYIVITSNGKIVQVRGE